MNFNKVLHGGHLTRDPILTYSQGGTAICKFSIASNYKRKDQERVCYVDCVAFGKTAETINQYLGKGDPIFVEGRLDFSKWEDKEGRTCTKHEIVVELFQFVGGRSAKREEAF
jgi:single-strand DNA-binding protein